MKKTISIILIIIFIGGVAYLLLAHHYIYREIGRAGLPASDTQGTYDFSANSDSSGQLVYSALGDSLTAGVGTLSYEESYPYLIAQKLTATGNAVTLNNRSYPGARTADIVKDLLPAAIADDPDIVTILAGVNDIHGFVSRSDFRNNYQAIISALKKRTHARIYAVGIPLIGSDSLLLPPYNYYFKSETVAFNRIIADLAESNNIDYIDLYTPTVDQLRPDGPLLAADRFHPSAAGYALWADIIYDQLNR